MVTPLWSPVTEEMPSRRGKQVHSFLRLFSYERRTDGCSSSSLTLQDSGLTWKPR